LSSQSSRGCTRDFFGGPHGQQGDSDRQPRQGPRGQEAGRRQHRRQRNIATSERWKKDGEQKEKTEWHRLVFWGRLAEIVGEYLHKGSRIYVEGKLQTREWEDNDGNKRWSTEINVREMKMLDRKGERDDSQNAKPAPAEPVAVAAGQGSLPVDDDDIPF